MGLFSSLRLADIEQACTLCDQESREAVCAACDQSLSRLDWVNACPGCAVPHSPAGLSAGGAVCGQCLKEAPAFDATIAAFSYRFPFDRLVQSFKFNANLTLTDFLGDRLVAAVRMVTAKTNMPLPDTLMALPLARQRLATRGFNQSALLAARVGQSLGIPVSHHGMLKVRDTPPQSGLSREARRKNVRGAFQCRSDLTGRHIALIDDVMTTGATLSEAARVLKNAGATRVSAWVLARALPETEA